MCISGAGLTSKVCNKSQRAAALCNVHCITGSWGQKPHLEGEVEPRGVWAQILNMDGCCTEVNRNRSSTQQAFCDALGNNGRESIPDSSAAMLTTQAFRLVHYPCSQLVSICSLLQASNKVMRDKASSLLGHAATEITEILRSYFGVLGVDAGDRKCKGTLWNENGALPSMQGPGRRWKGLEEPK